MDLQQVSQLLNIDFSEMILQSGFNKLSKKSILHYSRLFYCQIVRGEVDDSKQ